MKIDHYPENRSGQNTSATRWWIIGVLGASIAGIAAFPTTIPNVLADPPSRNVDFGELPDGGSQRGEGVPNRDSGLPTFPPVSSGGSRVAVSAPSTADGLSVAHAELPDGRQQTTVIDVRTRTMAVYHIDSRGVITLKSVRNLGWDLQIDDYNSGKPQPREIRALVERR